MSECWHGVIEDHKRNGLWVCSHCGKEGAWGPTWSVYGVLECRKCQCEGVDLVACSDDCRAALMESASMEARTVSARRRQAVIDQLSREIDSLVTRRRALQREDGSA